MIKTSSLLLASCLLTSSLNADTKSTYPKYKFGFQALGDATWLKYDGDTESGQELRRARVYLKAKQTQNLSYEIEYSLTGGGKWKDLYFKYANLPFCTTLKAGHIKEPIGLEALTSSKYNTFMERALPDAFIANRKLGATLSWHTIQKSPLNFTTTIGTFGESINKDDQKYGDYSTALRSTVAYIPQKNSLLHFGLSSSYTHYDDKKVRLSTRAESHMSPKFLKTKVKHSDSTVRVGAEAVYQIGSISLQSEYLQEKVETNKDESFTFSGWYAQASYFLTDDKRKYKRKTATFSRVKPKNPLGDGGYGAIELAARISHLDLNDGDREGGEADELTAGVNWYMYENLRVMANYVNIDLKDETIETPDIYQLRVQYDF